MTYCGVRSSILSKPNLFLSCAATRSRQLLVNPHKRGRVGGRSELLLEEQLDQMVGDMTVALMMTRREDLICVQHDRCADDAAGLMGEYFDQLPVLRHCKICGMVSRLNIPADDRQR